MSTRHPLIKPLWHPDCEAARRARVVERIVEQRRRRGLSGEHADHEVVEAEVAEQSRPRTLYAAGPEVNARRKPSEVTVSDDGVILDVPQPPYLPSLVGLSFVGAASAAGDFLERPEVVAAFNACLSKGSHNSYQVHVPLDDSGRLCPDAAEVYGPGNAQPLLAHSADGVVVTTWRGRWGLSAPDEVTAALQQAQRLVNDNAWMR